MVISLRTFINTTLLWIIVILGFRGYTRLIDPNPAKELLYAIGRSDLGNLTILQENTENKCDISEINMQTLVQKLNSMENMIQSTNVTCSMSQFALLKSIQPGITNSIPGIGALPELQTPTAPQYNFNIPVFNQQKNNNISPELQATSASLSVITRTTDLANPNIQDIFTIIKATELSPAEQAQGLINLLYNTPITLSTIKIENGILTLGLSGTTSLSSAQFGLIQAILEETYKQFPEISSVFIQQDS